MPSTFPILAGIAALALFQGAPIIAGDAGAKPRLIPPTAEDMDNFFPAKAALDGLGGRAVLHCTETAQGRLTACRVVSEAPDAYGFGSAALKLSARMGVTPGEAGRELDIPIRFQDPPPFREPRFKPHAGFGALGDPGPYYPDRAARNGVQGLAMLECLARAAGRLQSCRPVLELPRDAAFEEAALKMAQVGYMTVESRPSGEDEVVRVKVKFGLHGRWP
jgi:TonB family protein